MKVLVAVKREAGTKVERMADKLGAIQHLAVDEETPIFQVAGHGLVANLFTAVPELEKEQG